MVTLNFQNSPVKPSSFVVLAWRCYCSLLVLLQVCSSESTLLEHVVGDNVTFTKCNFSAGTDLTTMRFSKNVDMKPPTVRIAIKRDTIEIESPYKGRVSFSPAGDLVLRNITVSESGYYKCRLDGEEEEIYKYKLDVGAPPVIRPLPFKIVHVFEGKHLTVHCNASGEPTPKIWWLKNTTRVTQRHAETLEIKDARLSESDVYHCTAENRHGSASSGLLKIQVSPKPRVTEFFHDGRLDDQICECQDVRLTCEAARTHPPVTSFRFYHNGRLIKDGSEGVYDIVNIRPDEQGVYTCVPLNRLGVGLNKTLEIVVEPVSSTLCGRGCETKVESTTTKEKTILVTGSSESPPTVAGRKSSAYPRQPAVCLVTILLLLACIASLG